MKHKKLKATGRKEGLAVPLITGFPITTEIKSKPIAIKRAKSPPSTIHHTSQNYVHEQKKKKLNAGDPFPAKLSIKKFLIEQKWTNQIINFKAISDDKPQ